MWSLRTGSVTPLELDEIRRSEESEKNFWQERELASMSDENKGNIVDFQ